MLKYVRPKETLKGVKLPNIRPTHTLLHELVKVANVDLLQQIFFLKSFNKMNATLTIVRLVLTLVFVFMRNKFASRRLFFNIPSYNLFDNLKTAAIRTVLLMILLPKNLKTFSIAFVSVFLVSSLFDLFWGKTSRKVAYFNHHPNVNEGSADGLKQWISMAVLEFLAGKPMNKSFLLQSGTTALVHFLHHTVLERIEFGKSMKKMV
ncbi:hypothetical protein RCL1_001742 [Eukaryota sp. TZLM3-RCL]